jgi:carbonic anhydrase
MTTEDKLIPVESEREIPAEHRDDPIGLFLRYHNLGKSFDETYTTAQLLIGMCMDSRKHLRIPDNFAYIIRSGGANLRHADFKVSYAIGVGGVQAIALVGHNNCGMCGLHRRREQFVNGLVENAGWERQRAEDHFNAFAPIFEIGNEIEFVKEEAGRLNRRYPKIPVVPMIYKLEDNRIYLVGE